MSGRALIGLMSALVALLLAGAASAQVSVETQIAARKIEVGDGVQFQITALSPNDEAPQDPHLPPVAGVSVSGPNVGSRTQVSINNGRMVQQSGISASWTVRPLKVGSFRIGPASVDWNGKRFEGETVLLEVVPQGALPRANPRGGGPQPFDPFRFFDPFGGGSPFPPGLFGQNGPEQPEELPPVPEEFRVEHAPDSIAFLRATVSPKHPVVGEQVTVRIYAYGSRGPFRGSAQNDPTYPDFLDYSGQDDSLAESAVQVPIGDTTFIAMKLKELCLFPLHAGRLTITPMTFIFDGGRYRANPPISRANPPLTVDVSEPPLDGRPAGYRLGDVGTLELTTAVDPKRVTAGDSVGVVAKLEGTGSIPTVLHVPEQKGVEWLDPARVDEVHAEHGVVRGFRAFNYVVKLTEAGKVNLGELTLAYFDPKKRAYQTARASLGTVEVTPGQKPAAVASAEAAKAVGDPLALKARHSLDGYGPAATPFTDGSRFWYLLFGGPLAVALSGAGLELGGRWRRQRTSALSSPARLAQEALRAAEGAAKGSEIAKTAAAVERALFLAIEAGTGIRARALLKDDLKSALGSAGVAAASIERTLALLDACEAARFTGKTGDLSPKDLCGSARGLIAELSRKRRSS